MGRQHKLQLVPTDDWANAGEDMSVRALQIGCQNCDGCAHMDENLTAETSLPTTIQLNVGMMHAGHVAARDSATHLSNNLS